MLSFSHAACVHPRPRPPCPTLQVGRAMYAQAGELGLPVAHMPFKGLLGVADDIEALAAEYPQTVAIIDHFGFCKVAFRQRGAQALP